MKNKFSTGFSFLYYQLKIIWQINFWLAPVGIVLLLFAVNYPYIVESDIRLYWAVKMNEMMFPVIGIVLLGNIISQEFEKGTINVWFGKPINRSVILIGRILLISLFLATILLIPSIYQNIAYINHSYWKMLLTTFTPALFLGVLGMIVGIIFENSAISFLIPTAYWIFEIATKGKYTRSFALFSRATHIDCLTDKCVEFVQTNLWIDEKITLLIISALLILFSIRILNKKGRKLISPIK